MALHTKLPITKTCEALLSLAADVQGALPRNYRVLGDRIFQRCIDLIELIAEANAAKGEQREISLDRMLRKLETVKLLLRLAKEKKLISPDLWSRSALLTGSAGRQGGGWLSSTERNRAPAA